MLTSAPADCSFISVMTLICLSIYWLIGKRFLKRTHRSFNASDVCLLCVLSAGNIAKSAVQFHCGLLFTYYAIDLFNSPYLGG